MRHPIISIHRSWLTLLALATILLATLACGFEGGAFGSTPVPTSINKVLIPAISSGAAQPTSTHIEPTLAAAMPNAAQGPMETIVITSPQSGQGVRGTLRIEGSSDPAVAQQLNVLLRDEKGTVIATARPVSQARTDQRSAFSADLIIPPDVPRQTGHLQVYAISPKDNGIMHLSSVLVELNSDAPSSVATNPQTPEAIAMIFPSPNAEVKGVVKVAAATLLGPKIVVEVRDANNKTVGRVEQTVNLPPSGPAQVQIEVPIQISAAGPGRVLVYVVNAGDGSTEHLNSVEVNLVP